MSSREAVEPTKRKAISAKTRLAVFDRAGGRCEMCSCKLTPGWELDHVLSLWMGGADEMSNYRALCPPCHRTIKTPDDIGKQSKVRRIIAREDGTRRERKKIPSRGFPTGKRKLNGSAFRREK